MTKDFHTVAECAYYLDKPYGWVLEQIKRNPKFPKRKVGGKYVIPNKELGLWMAETGFVRK